MGPPRCRHHAGATTTLSSGGAALSLHSDEGPALRVNTGARVTNLNADKLDGYSAGAFASAAAKTGTVDAGGVEVDRDENGAVDTIAAYAECPAVGQMTGGGGGDLTDTGRLLLSVPDPDGYEAWIFAVDVDETHVEDPAEVLSTVTCWAPSGRQIGRRTAVTGPLPPGWCGS